MIRKILNTPLGLSAPISIQNSDDLPFGAIKIDKDGIVLAYNEYESSMSGRDSKRVIGKNFFTHVAPCTNVEGFYGVFLEIVANKKNEASFSFIFAFHMTPIEVLIDILPDTQDGMYWIFVRPTSILKDKGGHPSIYNNDYSEDLIFCENEPIRIPNEIQSHGAIIVLDPAGEVIVAISDNLLQFIDIPELPCIGSRIRESFPMPVVSAITQSIASMPFSRSVTIEGLARKMLATASREKNLNLLLIELENHDDTIINKNSQVNHLDFITKCNDIIINENDFDDIAQSIAHEIRELTEFDRVIIYKFYPDWSGEAIAESKSPDWSTSLIGLRFPSRDIPRQARELYHEFHIRAMPDAKSMNVKILKDASTPDIDLSRVLLRSMSQNHKDYHEVMGVRGSWSVSLMHDGQLWGLLIGHHRNKKGIQRSHLQSIKVIGNILTIQLEKCIRKKEDISSSQALERYNNIKIHTTNSNDLIRSLVTQEFGYMQMLQPASGVALIANGQVISNGVTPPHDKIIDLNTWVNSQFPTDGIVHTNTLPLEYTPILPWASIASGVLAIRFPDENNSTVIIFRPEVERMIVWAGVPTTQGSPQATPGPSRSFANWLESQKYHSAPWQSWDLQIARDLRQTIGDLENHKMKGMKALHDKIKQADDMKTNFMATVSHELRTPLNAILGFADLIKSHEDQKHEIQLFADEILTAGNHLLSIVNDILQFSAATSGKFRLELEEVDIKSPCSIAMNMIKTMYDKKRTILNLIEPRTPLIILGDHRRLVQILLNLLSNALKFTPPGGVVTILLEAANGYATLTVSDNGDGIPEDKISTVLEPFTQAFNSFNRPHDGIGLGLSIVQQLVQLHGGTISLSSQLGRGTNVSLHFPLQSQRKLTSNKTEL